MGAGMETDELNAKLPKKARREMKRVRDEADIDLHFRILGCEAGIRLGRRTAALLIISVTAAVVAVALAFVWRDIEIAAEQTKQAEEHTRQNWIAYEAQEQRIAYEDRRMNNERRMMIEHKKREGWCVV